MKALPKGHVHAAALAAFFVTSPPAYAQDRAGKLLVRAMARYQQCVDPSVAAERENLDKPICTGPPPAPAGSPNWFKHGFFPITEGRVGYHMTSHNAYYDSDVPPECNHSAQYSYMLQAAVEGDLPPGLTYSSEEGQFEGTPRQPGDWDVTVVYSHMRCRGSDLDFGDRRIPVHFHINP